VFWLSLTGKLCLSVDWLREWQCRKEEGCNLICREALICLNGSGHDEFIKCLDEHPGKMDVAIFRTGEWCGLLIPEHCKVSEQKGSKRGLGKGPANEQALSGWSGARWMQAIGDSLIPIFATASMASVLMQAGGGDAGPFTSGMR
jgi:hypothetical protein